MVFSSFPDPKNSNERKEIVVKLRMCDVRSFSATHSNPTLVSQDPGNYADAPTEGIRRVLEIVTGEKITRGEKLPTDKIGKLRFMIDLPI